MACGDGWHLRADGHTTALSLIDGLGHGLPAADAAQAGTAAMATASAFDAATLIGTMHAGMSGSRGGAAAVACVGQDGQNVQFAGIGNISASLCEPTGSRGMASHPASSGCSSARHNPSTFTLTQARCWSCTVTGCRRAGACATTPAWSTATRR